MIEFAWPRNPWYKAFSLAIKIYLSLTLAGCSSAPPPGIEDVRNLQTRIVGADYNTSFKAAVDLLHDLGFVVDEADIDAGVISASARTEKELGQVMKEAGLVQEDDDDLPTWAKVVIIATGVILIIGLIALIAGSGDDDEDEPRSKGDGGTSGSTHTTTFVTVEDDESEGIEYYDYRISLLVEELSDSTTTIRTNAQRSKMKGDNVIETGPVHDARFFEGFYSGLDKSLSFHGEKSEFKPDQP